MAILIDASSPDAVSGGGAQTTAAFSPPASTVLVAGVVATADTTVSGGSLTWTQQIFVTATGVHVALWTAPCPGGATGITVAGSGMGVGGMLKVSVLTGAKLVGPTGATGTGATATNDVTVSAYNSTADASRGFIAAADGNFLGQPSSSDPNDAFHLNPVLSGLVARKAADTPTSGAPVSFNLDAFGTGVPDWRWAALEIMAAPDPVPKPLIVNRAAIVRSYYM